MDLYERRVLKLREHVKNNASKSNKKADNNKPNAITQGDKRKAHKGDIELKTADDYTKDEIMDILDRLGIEYSSRRKKEELFDLIP